MSLITTSYFAKDISIPTGTYSNLSNDIEKYEPEIIKEVSGYELGKLINAYDSSTSPQRIKDIVEGKEYTVSYNGRDQTIKWNGLINTELISFIAYYVYYWWQRNNITSTSTTGEIKPKNENSIIVGANAKACAAWYRMRQLIGYSGQSVVEPSLYNFLTEYEDDYPEWIFKDVGSINIFGI
jgi:hypothetical protein